MATEILTVSANSTPDAWSANSGTKPDAVATDDSDTLYIEPDSAGASQQFTLSDSSVIGTTDMIPVVTVTAIIKATTSTPLDVTASLSDGTNVLSGGTLMISSTSYATYEWEFSLTPDNAGAWAIADLNSLEVRLTASATNVRCTKLTVVATYYKTTTFRHTYPLEYTQGPTQVPCAMTAMYAPANDMEGGYIKDYAPHDRTRGITHRRPRTGKDLGG